MLEIRNVHKYFGKLYVIKGISLNVEKAEVVVLIGPSGSGKSTLLRCINGLEQFQEGEIFVDGVKLGARGTNIRKIRSEIGMVFQQFNLFSHRTALQNVCEGLIYVRHLDKKVLKRVSNLE
jgi:ABC-type polar amino acid transport system ATPase subunit